MSDTRQTQITDAEMYAGHRNELLKVTIEAIQARVLKDFDRDTLMRLFFHVFGRTSPMCDWIAEQAPYESSFLRGIYDDALAAKDDGAKANGAKQPKRANPDLLTDDAAPEFLCTGAGPAGERHQRVIHCVQALCAAVIAGWQEGYLLAESGIARQRDRPTAAPAS